MKISRRNFGKLLASLSFSGAALAAYEQNNDQETGPEAPQKTNNIKKCKTDIVSSESSIACDPEKCIFWIDGIYIDKSRLNIRANLTFLLKFNQKEDHFIDKVVLADGDKNTLGVRYFEPEDKISSGYPPYLIFQNIDLAKSRRFFLVFRVIESGDSLIYRKTLSSHNMRRSRLDSSELPARIRLDLDKAHSGIITNLLQFRSRLGPKTVRQHQVRAMLRQITSDNRFIIRVYFFHSDADATHYNRYFLVTDPVGRLLGLSRRSFGDNKRDYVEVTALTENERTTWGLTRDKVAKINDCPYIMVFADDVGEALCRTIIYLR